MVLRWGKTKTGEEDVVIGVTLIYIFNSLGRRFLSEENGRKMVRGKCSAFFFW